MSTADIFNTVLNPIFLAVLTVTIGICTYAYQIRQNREAAESERQRLLYESLIEQVFNLLSAKPGKERSAALTEIEKAWLFASDEVLRVCYKVLDVYDRRGESDHDLAKSIIEKDDARKEFQNAVAELFFVMRTEVCGQKTAITKDWAENVVKVYKSGAPAEHGYTNSEPRNVAS